MSRLKAPNGGGGGAEEGCVKCPGQVAPTTGSLVLVPPRPKYEVFKVFEPKRVGSLPLPW